MIVDWSIRLGDVVSFVGFVVGGLSVIFMMRGDIRSLGLKIGFLEEKFEEKTQEQNIKIDKQSEEIARFADLLVIMGKYEERFAGIQRQIDDLKHGRGFIKNGP